MNTNIKMLTVLLSVAVCLSALVGCSDTDVGETTASNTVEKQPNAEYNGILNDYKVVYEGYGAASFKDGVAKFAKKLGLEAIPDKSSDGEYEDNGGLEILIGNTTRQQSTAALDELSSCPSATEEYFYSVTVTEDARVVIVGNKLDATLRALDVLLEEYISKTEEEIKLNIEKNESIYGGYPYKLITASNGTTLFTEVISTVYDPGSGSVNYPNIIELQHSGESNGTLLAVMEISASAGFRICRSTDGGKTWKFVITVKESIENDLRIHWMPYIYELPCQVGDMPKGTLLLAGTTAKVNPGRSHITIWRSFDNGSKWEQYSEVAIGGGTYDTSPADETYHGVWEPYIFYDNGRLYCFYSDDSDPLHDQKISYKTSADGVNWEDQVDVVCFEEYHWRPGMMTVAKMGNGKYFCPYERVEYFGGNTDIYFKIVDSLDGDWNPTDSGTKLVSVTKGAPSKGVGSAPWCAWSPAGGECGTLVLNATWGGEKHIYVSFDYGESFEALENPLSSPQMSGYSPSFFFSSDGSTLFYLNRVAVNSTDAKYKIQFAKVIIKSKSDKWT